MTYGYFKRISKGATLGSYLQGTITFCKDEIGKKVDVYTFKFVLSEPAKKSVNQNNKVDKELTTKWHEYKKAMRDLKCSWLAKLGEYFFFLFCLIVNCKINY
jgi:tripeptidyl-peptidase-2